MAQTCEFDSNELEAQYNGKNLCEDCLVDELWMETLREGITSDDMELRSMTLTVLQDSRVFDTLRMNVYEHCLKWLVRNAAARIYEFTEEDLAGVWEPNWKTTPDEVIDAFLESDIIHKEDEEDGVITYRVGNLVEEVGRDLRTNRLEENEASRILTGKLVLELAHEKGGRFQEGGLGGRKFLKSIVHAIDEFCLDEEGNLNDNQASIEQVAGENQMGPMKFMSKLSSMAGIEDGDQKIIEGFIPPTDSDSPWGGKINFKMDWIKTRQRARQRFRDMRERGEA